MNTMCRYISPTNTTIPTNTHDPNENTLCKTHLNDA